MMSDGVLNRSWHNRLLKRNNVKELRCFRCGEKIEIGDSIHTNSGQVRCQSFGGYTNASNKPLRLYHAECFEQMYIEV
jgi:hypothetical protein